MDDVPTMIIIGMFGVFALLGIGYVLRGLVTDDRRTVVSCLVHGVAEALLIAIHLFIVFTVDEAEMPRFITSEELFALLQAIVTIVMGVYFMIGSYLLQKLVALIVRGYRKWSVEMVRQMLHLDDDNT